MYKPTAAHFLAEKLMYKPTRAHFLAGKPCINLHASTSRRGSHVRTYTRSLLGGDAMCKRTCVHFSPGKLCTNLHASTSWRGSDVRTYTPHFCKTVVYKHTRPIFRPNKFLKVVKAFAVLRAGFISSEALTGRLFQIQITVAITQKTVIVVECMLVNPLPVIAHISRNEQ